jgi:hypothetical protein
LAENTVANAAVPKGFAAFEFEVAEIRKLKLLGSSGDGGEQENAAVSEKEYTFHQRGL